MSYTARTLLVPPAGPDPRAMTLTKREIARAIHEAEPGISIAEAVRLIDRMFDLVKRELELGGRVMVTNFGSFAAVDRAPRRGVNPATGATIRIPGRRAVVFHPAPALQDLVDD